MRALWIVLALISLTACSAEDDRPASDTPAADTSDAPAVGTEAGETGGEGDASTKYDSLRSLARDPEALREAMQDPERRQAMRERMRAMREQRRAESDVDPESRRAAMRERAERLRDGRGRDGPESMSPHGRSGARFWEDDATVEALGLSESQVSSLADAHEQLGEAGRESRQALARVASGLPDALAATDRERLRSLVEARREAIASRAQAEAEWMAAVLSTLSDDQLRQLAEDRLGLVRRLASPN